MQTTYATCVILCGLLAVTLALPVDHQNQANQDALLAVDAPTHHESEVRIARSPFGYGGLGYGGLGYGGLGYGGLGYGGLGYGGLGYGGIYPGIGYGGGFGGASASASAAAGGGGFGFGR